MAKRKGLTDKQVNALPRKSRRYVLADPQQRGLFLRVETGLSPTPSSSSARGGKYGRASVAAQTRRSTRRGQRRTRPCGASRRGSHGRCGRQSRSQ